mgnify:CR=1 FL=1
MPGGLERQPFLDRQHPRRGPGRDVLYVTASDKVFKRKVKTKGIDSWKPPIFQRMPRL